MANQSSSDYYAVLGISRTATHDEIEKQYTRLMKALADKRDKFADRAQSDPDLYVGDTYSEIIKVIEEAHNTLSDKTKRKIYDHSLHPSPVIPQPVGKQTILKRPGTPAAPSVAHAVQPTPSPKQLSVHKPAPVSPRWFVAGIVAVAILVSMWIIVLAQGQSSPPPMPTETSVVLVWSTPQPYTPWTPTDIPVKEIVGSITEAQSTKTYEFPPSPTYVPTDVPYVQPTDVPNVETVGQCTGGFSQPSRLDIGKRGYVPRGNSATPNRLRKDPSQNAQVIGQIPPGGIFLVLEGPSCGEGITWWKVSYKGQEGWTAEGERSNYYTEPYGGDPSVQFAPPDNRSYAPANSRRATSGKGLTTGIYVTDGDFQVEGYCNRSGTAATQNDSDWYCGRRRLTVADFDAICRMTYGVKDIFAIQDGNNSIPAYNWKCYVYTS